MNPVKYLEMAAVLSRVKDDKRTFFIGCVGIRSDGRIVGAYNGNPRFPEPKHHGEYRLSRKLTKASVVFVARTLWDGSWAMAKPCSDCHQRLKNLGTIRVYYSMGPGEYGVVYL